jgi:ATP-binding cassette subfamily F protein 3
MIVLTRANFLLLDEPTNHLDVESIEAVEDAVRAYGGTALLVSHDRALLRALATRVWVLHDRRITDYEGTFEEWEAASEEREHAARVAAREEEALRRVSERRQTRAPAARSGSGALRAARRSLAAAEARVAELEERVRGIERRLEDPALYGTPEGIREAAALGRDLETGRAELEGAIEAWASAVAEIERIEAAAGAAP